MGLGTGGGTGGVGRVEVGTLGLGKIVFAGGF